MNDGLLPPVPDLIPISVLRKRPSTNNNNNNSESNSDGGPSECAPCSEVMGEQRPRRRSTAQQPAVELIDNAGSRGGWSAAPQAPQPQLSRKIRPERHRKSDRRRDRRKLNRTRSCCKHSAPNSSTNSPPKSRDVDNRSGNIGSCSHNPRVNPIFVWVRQEDTRIVDVKCEDYDKRNRILLTKTAQGWRAIPRTETLVPTLKEAVKDQQHHHHKSKKSRKGKVRRRSTGVQVSSDIEQEYEENQQPQPQQQQQKQKEEQEEINVEEEKKIGNSPPWMSTDNVNVESLLPSHTIKVKRSTSPNNSSPERDSNVNSDCAQTPSVKCSADRICDVSPLDNLLAVAELEFKQQIQSEEWNKSTRSNDDDDDIITNEDAIVSFNNFNQSSEEEDKEFMKNLETLNSLIDSEKSKLDLSKEDIDSIEPKTEECDYNDDDDNNLAMDDILSRLEQSLRSPDVLVTEANNCDTNSQNKHTQLIIKDHADSDNEQETDLKSSVPDFEELFEETDPKIEEENERHKLDIKSELPEIINLVESSTNDDEDDTPTDLSIKTTQESVIVAENNEEPTDLSIPKISASPRPPSQNSEAIQSPQPSGIPAVPQSPDIVSTTVNVSNKPKSVFLESLLTTCSTKKINLNSEVTITAQREPLDLGKCRKSASPTVTCSEEIHNSVLQSEPPAKKIKSVDITLKNLLDADCQKNNSESKISEKNFSTETPKLLELLQNEAETDPLVQLKQLLSDSNIDVPDPLLVPKEKFSQILIHPGTEIPKLLKERPELRLPQALAFPHIMQDPNMLVINIHHLESILSNKNTINKAHSDTKNQDKQEKQSDSNQQSKKKTNENAKNNSSSSSSTSSIESQTKIFNELANDINTATQAAFNQMWFPYMNHLEAMALANNPDFMKMLNSVHLPFYMNQIPEAFSGMRAPVSPMGFSMPPPVNYGNSVEFNMWQEAMFQAQLLKNKNLENSNTDQNIFKNHLDKINAQSSRNLPNNNCVNPRIQSSNKPQTYSNQYFQKDQNAFQNPYANYNSYQQTKASHQNIQNYQKPSTNQKLQHTFQPKSSNNFPHQMNQSFANLYSQEKHQYMQTMNNNASLATQQDQFHQNFMRKDLSSLQKPKTQCKPFTNFHPKSVPLHEHHQKERSNNSGGNDPAKVQTSQPIDLSGSMTPAGGKLKVKQHLIDPCNASKLLKQHDDVPEVGSTTASIEEMQDAHKHLWHPLFGNQKGYTSPWNWTTVTATGE